MARWIFRQTIMPSAGPDAIWLWELEHASGKVVSRSACNFPDMTLCMNDAAHYGYYAGHYAVTIRRDYCGPQSQSCTPENCS